MKAAVTGGGGFVGSALIRQLSEAGWRINALARNPKKMPSHEGLTVFTGDLGDRGALARLSEEADVFFHLAGVTHPRDDREYHRVNVTGAGNAAEAAAKAGAKFVHISSLSARSPAASPYAASKFESEAAIADRSNDNEWIALRLPAIYGPRDTATLPYFKMVKSGLALEPRTPSPAKTSLLFVEDAADAIIAAASGAPPRGVYDVDDDCDGGREWREIGEILASVFDKKAIRLRAPRAPVSLYFGLIDDFQKSTNRPRTGRTGQVNEFFHPDWTAKDHLLSKACKWKAKTPLREGFTETVRWYVENRML